MKKIIFAALLLSVGIIFPSYVNAQTLIEAIEAGDNQTVCTLLENGADPEETNTRFETPLNERDFIISNESKGLFFCSSRNIGEDFRQYEIKVVLFYKNFDDIIAGRVLGEEYDLGKAYYYIKEMFRPYQK